MTLLRIPIIAAAARIVNPTDTKTIELPNPETTLISDLGIALYDAAIR